ncbi:MAG: GLPGLI family protein [Ferruginibacter sp.]
MKRILFSASGIICVFMCQAQLKQGKIIYERTAQMRMMIADNDTGEQSKVQTRTDKFELTFGNNQSLWKQAEKETEDEPAGDNGGVQIRMVVAGSDDILYTNIPALKRTELRVFFDKKFIVDDSITPLKWKVTEDTKTILGHLCRKATTTTITPRMSMNINNGMMERKEVQDTAVVTAWFTNDIPVAVGPAEYQGQLPGLILAIDINNGRQVFKAIEISDKADIASIKAPAGKKHYSPLEFRKERDKMMDEMQQNNHSGNQRIRMN